MEVDFCYIISHGFTARMLLQTDLVGRLTKLDYSVAIVAPDIQDENLASLQNNPKIHLIEWAYKSTIWDDDYLHKRMYYLEDLSKNSALREKVYNSLFYSNSKHPWKRLRPLYYYCIYLLIKIFPSIRRKFVLHEGKHLASSEAQEIIKKINPKILVSTYPVSIIEAKLLHAAKKMGIKTVSQLLSWDNISCKGKFPVLAEKHIVWGDIMKEELMEFYDVPIENIKLAGVPHFDEHIRVRNEVGEENVLAHLSLNDQRPYIFFAMSSPRFAPREIDVIEWLSNAVRSDVFGAFTQLVIRPHPQNLQEFTSDKTWIDRLSKLSNDRVGIDYPSLNQSKIKWSMQQEDMVKLARMISGCTVCLNSGSTVIIDALLHNKPVVLTSFDGDKNLPYWNSARRLIDYAHLHKIIKEGGAKPVGSYEELKSIIKLYIGQPDHDLDKRRNALYRECYQDDGQATDRVIQCLIDVLAEDNNMKKTTEESINAS